VFGLAYIKFDQPYENEGSQDPSRLRAKELLLDEVLGPAPRRKGKGTSLR